MSPIRSIAVGVVLVLVSAAPATRPVPAKPQDIPGVENFAKVSDILYRGAQPTEEGFAELKRRGIKTVVNLRSFHGDRSELKGLGLRYAHIYCKAWHPEDEDTVKFLKILEDPANHPVFVHCQEGADRTGCVVAVYRIVEQGWTLEQAVEEMHDFGFHPVWFVIEDYLDGFNPAKVKKKMAKVRKPKVEVVK